MFCHQNGGECRWKRFLSALFFPPPDFACSMVGQGLVHRDIKPANVFLSVAGNAVLGDMGLTGTSTNTASMGGVCTVRYAPPEVLLGDVGSMAADVYSLGLVSFETLTLEAGKVCLRWPRAIGVVLPDHGVCWCCFRRSSEGYSPPRCFSVSCSIAPLDGAGASGQRLCAAGRVAGTARRGDAGATAAWRHGGRLVCQRSGGSAGRHRGRGCA